MFLIFGLSKPYVLINCVPIKKACNNLTKSENKNKEKKKKKRLHKETKKRETGTSPWDNSFNKFGMASMSFPGSFSSSECQKATNGPGYKVGIT